MTKQKRLDTGTRNFLQVLAEVIFSNPFSFDKKKIENILGHTIEQDLDEHHYIALIPVLKQYLDQLAMQGIESVNDVSGKDKILLEYAYRFEVYHDYVDDFEELINKQTQQGVEPVTVWFAKPVIRKLIKRGFTEEEALRNLALFYQLRRAYYFIIQALSGHAPCMQQLRHSLWNHVFTYDARLYLDHLWNRMEDFSTLLLGETGTGKGTAAAAIGRSGFIPFDVKKGCFKVSFTETFVAMNLSEFSAGLIESELFGHRKGAFTGAIDNYKGLFERCSRNGSLFLDEIGDVATPIQIKLLNVLQDRRFTPVGSHESHRFEGRVIAATNRSLDELRERGEFRDDFYYRLSSDVIEVPTLRQRLSELPSELHQLVDLLVMRLLGKQSNMLVDKIMKVLSSSLPADYPWPGNVRELEQAVRRIILSGQYKPAGKSNSAKSNWLKQASTGDISAQDLLAQYCNMLYSQTGTYEEVSAITALDRRTVKKYIEMTDN
jgi:DNA-binding NtrC family response regulator